MNEADRWISALKLAAHPEGGHYRETYRARKMVKTRDARGERPAFTLIFFLLKSGERSLLHRIRSDEAWHFYAGGSLTIHEIGPNGAHRRIKLGRHPGAGETLHAVLPAGCWFGATVDNPRSYSLVGCTVAPGFDFKDFELADRRTLAALYPRHKAVIKRLTQRKDGEKTGRL